jgi:Fic family protein
LYLYIRKEAVLSSQIEGTQSSLSDLLLYETDEVPGVPLDDVQEVSCYVSALNHGLARIRGELPLSVRLLCEIHGVLLASGRGSEKMPGEVRTSQNWIGGTRPGNALFVPPPPYEVMPCLGALEKFLHNDPVRTPTLIKAALAHVQFETIHPFLDGNGRLGRLLITLLLCAEGAMSEPLLYLSLYFKTHRDTYYEQLQRVRVEGDWEAWLRFFLEGVISTAEQATTTAHRVFVYSRYVEILSEGTTPL